MWCSWTRIKNMLESLLPSVAKSYHSGYALCSSIEKFFSHFFQFWSISRREELIYACQVRRHDKIWADVKINVKLLKFCSDTYLNGFSIIHELKCAFTWNVNLLYNFLFPKEKNNNNALRNFLVLFQYRMMCVFHVYWRSLCWIGWLG